MQDFTSNQPQTFDDSGGLGELGSGGSRPNRSFSLLISWFIILAITIGGVVVVNLSAEEAGPADGGSAAQDKLLKFQARMALSQAQLAGPDQAYQGALALNVGTPTQRMCFSVLANELKGPDEALSVLDQIEQLASDTGHEFSDASRTSLDALRTAYLDYSDGADTPQGVTSDEASHLQQQLGWFGELALTPEGSPDVARREELLKGVSGLVWAMVIGLIIAGLIGLAGLVALVILFVMALIGKLPNRIGGRLEHGHVYAETFALWMVMFFGMNFAAKTLPLPPSNGLALSAGLFFLSLLTLVWPVLRGISWRQVRHDIGWRKPEAGPLEPLFGIASYAMTLPVLGVGIVCVLVLFALVQGAQMFGGVDEANPFAPTTTPTHPIVEYIGQFGTWGIIQVYLLAAVAAPIVEETMFRGVLYRHLRSWTGKWPVALSIIVGATVNSTIFAVIHPQGLIAAPALIALAVAMTLAREWRGSLWSSMMIHGISNGVVMTMLITLMG